MNTQNALVIAVLGNAVDIFFRDEDGTDRVVEERSLTALDDQWHHVAVNRTGGTVTAYLDGAQTATGTAAGLDDMRLDTGNPGRIGCRDDSIWPFDGEIDDVRVYDRVLTVDDIAEVMAFTGVPRDCPAQGDRDCTNVDVVGPVGDIQGIYTVTATATDQTEDNDDEAHPGPRRYLYDHGHGR